MPRSPLLTEIERRRAGRHLLLLCDFDGTLAPFHPDPAAVVLDRDLHAVLSALARGPDSTVAIVSGRRLADLRQRLSLPGPVFLAGSHGLEIQGPDELFRHPDALRAAARLREMVQILRPLIGSLPGVFIEDKEISIVLHYREASDGAAATARSCLIEASRQDVEAGRLRLLSGACVLELLPAAAWDKGRAVDWIRERVERHRGRVFAIYVGDDVTDDDAFRAVGLDGMTIAASDRASGAEFSVDGPEGVRQLLLSLAGPLPQDGDQ